MKKRLLYILLLLISGFIAFHFYAPRLIVEIKNPLIELVRNQPSEIPTEHGLKNSTKTISIASEDGIKLSALITYTAQDTVHGSVILLHGIRGRKEHFQKISRQLNDQGFHAIAMDLRAHGESGGQYCTFGHFEKKDVSALIDYLIEKEQMKNIGVWGQSLGGAVALQSLAHDDRLAFGIIESTFNKFTNTVHNYTKYFAGFNVDFLTNDVINRAGRLAGFNPSKINPEEICKNIEQPIFIGHGGQDKRIPASWGRANYEAVKSIKKEFVLVDQAGHGNLWKLGGRAYMNRIFKFLDETTKA